MLEKIKARLIDDWQLAYKFASVKIMALSGVVLAAWAADPDLIREIIPPRYLHTVLALVILSGIVARITRKPDNTGADK